VAVEPGRTGLLLFAGRLPAAGEISEHGEYVTTEVDSVGGVARPCRESLAWDDAEEWLCAAYSGIGCESRGWLQEKTFHHVSTITTGYSF
jgi:hypothetical protein